MMAMGAVASAAIVASKLFVVMPKADYDELEEFIKQKSEDFYEVRKMYNYAVEENAKLRDKWLKSKALNCAIREVIESVDGGAIDGRKECECGSSNSADECNRPSEER